MRLFASNVWLIAAGALSVIASLTHLAIIVGGPNWYRFFGAGEHMARMAERGAWTPTLFAVGIAAVLMVWAAYAFSAAGLIRQLPLTRTALILISVVLILRALAYFVRESWRPDLSQSFMLWSSLIVFVLGLCFAIGTWRAWSRL
ncbi:MAG: hypothetical protein AABY88_02290 [Pseudomonadota bacterium]